MRDRQKEYSLSIFMAECDLEEEDCLRYGELSEIVNLGTASDGEPFLFRLFEEFGRVKSVSYTHLTLPTILLV